MAGRGYFPQIQQQQQKQPVPSLASLNAMPNMTKPVNPAQVSQNLSLASVNPALAGNATSVAGVRKYIRPDGVPVYSNMDETPQTLMRGSLPKPVTSQFQRDLNTVLGAYNQLVGNNQRPQLSQYDADVMASNKNRSDNSSFLQNQALHANDDQIAKLNDILSGSINSGDDRVKMKYAGAQLDRLLGQQANQANNSTALRGQDINALELADKLASDQKNQQSTTDQSNKKMAFDRESQLLGISIDLAKQKAEMENKPSVYENELAKQRAKTDVEVEAQKKQDLKGAQIGQESLNKILNSLYPGGKPVFDKNGKFIPPKDQMILGNSPWDRTQMAYYENLGGDNPQAQNLQNIRRETKNFVMAAVGGKLGAGVSNADIEFLQQQQGIIDKTQNINDVYNAAQSMQDKINEIKTRSGGDNSQPIDAQQPSALPTGWTIEVQ
jgi:hypothetical protein